MSNLTDSLLIMLCEIHLIELETKFLSVDKESQEKLLILKDELEHIKQNRVRKL